MKKAWYYYFEGERAVGPLERADIIERIEKSLLGPYQLMIRDGEDNWRPVLAFDEFRDLVKRVKPSRQTSTEWVILKKETGRVAFESMGPFTAEEVRQRLLDGSINYTDYAWKDGMHQWRRLATLKDFSPAEKPAMPPPPPLVKLPPPPALSKQEVARFVEVVEKKFEPPAAVDLRPDDADGDDLTKPITMNQVVVTPPAPVPPLPASKPVTVRTVPPIPDSETKTSTEPVISVSPRAKPESSPEKSFEERRRERREARKRKSQAVPEAPRPAADEDSSGENSVVQHLSRIYNMRVTLPRNWKQILGVLVVVVIAWYKLFGPHSQPVETVPPPPSRPEVSAPVRPPQQKTMEQAPIETVSQRPPAPARPASPKRPVHYHPATRLRIHVEQKNGELASMNIETDAPPDQVIWLEVIGSAGMVADRPHYYKKWKWSSSQPFEMGGELPAGFYRLHASTGDLVSEERFEIGTHQKGFAERLRATRKHGIYDFWTERKKLYLLTKQLSKVLAGHYSNAQIDRLSRFQISSYAFYDLWQEFKDVCKDAKKQELATAKERLQNLQIRISQLSVWK